MKIQKTHVVIFMSFFTLISSVLIGLFLGATFAGVVNNINQEDFGLVKMPEASKIYDIKGRLITELFSEQKRDIVKINEMPPFLIQALLTREDRDFYKHGGFSTWGLVRAAINNILGGHRQGASTITQQLAGLLYANRNEKTVFRKVVELYYAMQLEKKLSKDEILQLYLNQMYFGHGCYGVEAASQFHFGHSVREITPSEAVMLVIQLANWNEYSPRKNPVRARKMQETILYDMVDLGYISKEEASASFDDYWKNFDITLQSGSAFQLRKDLAPYFTMYVQQKLDEMIFGNMNVYQDGLEIYTTLNLDFQLKADEIMKTKLEKVNKEYGRELSVKSTAAESFFLPVVDLLSLNYNMPHMHVDKRRHMIDTIDTFAEDINPTLDITTSMFGLEKPKEIAKQIYQWQLIRSRTTHVQGALICIDPYTGYIYAMVGGREFNSDNQINYATQSYIHPGSAFKPLFYSAAIEEKKISPSSILQDVQMVFQMPSGKTYIPNNYGDTYHGNVSAREALANSLNIPAISVMEKIGFDSAISMASKLLGINDPAEVQRVFPRYWSLALGVVNTSPLAMARAFCAFPNGGKGIEPISILYVKDRNGRIIAEPEKERIAKLQYGGGQPQLMRAQTAYLMLDMLKTTVKEGTLTFAKEELGDIKYPLGGKTGTTQNWHDAWTVGFSPYFVTVVWFGFDKGGGSLGTNRTGATLASPTWGKFMHDIHKQLDDDQDLIEITKRQIEKDKQTKGAAKNVSTDDIAKELHIPSLWLQVIQEERSFHQPPGLVEYTICSKSGLKPSKYCPRSELRKELYYPESIPEKECTYHKDRYLWENNSIEKIRYNAELEIDIPKTSDLIEKKKTPDSFEEFMKNKDSILKKETPPPNTQGSQKDDQKKPINPYLD